MRRRWRLWGFMLLIAVACAVFVVAGGTALIPYWGTFVPVATPPAGRFLFVQERREVRGIEALPRLNIDFPTYEFVSGKVVETLPGMNTLLKDSDWGYLGRYVSRTGTAGSGAGSRLYPIAAIPVTTTLNLPMEQTHEDCREDWRDAELKLVAVAADGVVEALIDGDSYYLKPEQSWSRRYDVNCIGLYPGRYEIYVSLANYGWIDRSQIYVRP